MNEYRLLSNLEVAYILQLGGRDYYDGRMLNCRPFNLFLVYHHISDTFWDIPFCMGQAVYTQIIRGSRVLPGASIMAPLFYREGSCCLYRGGESLFNNVFSSDRYLKKVKDPSGNVYYGGFGCIFDKDFHPIIVICRRITLQDSEFEIRGDSKVLKVDKEIYQHNDRLLEKFILNKMLPTVLRNNTFNCVEFSSLNGYTMRPCEGIEESINNDSLNECLQANLEALLEDV